MKRDALLRDAALLCVMAFLVISAYLYGGAGQTWQPQSTTGSALDSPSDTASPTPGPLVVVIWSPTPLPTVFSTVTPKPIPTMTPVVLPPCLPGIATPGSLCRETLPTPTVWIPTEIATWPGEGTAVVGQWYWWTDQ